MRKIHTVFLLAQPEASIDDFLVLLSHGGFCGLILNPALGLRKRDSAYSHLPTPAQALLCGERGADGTYAISQLTDVQHFRALSLCTDTSTFECQGRPERKAGQVPAPASVLTEQPRRTTSKRGAAPWAWASDSGFLVVFSSTPRPGAL